MKLHPPMVVPSIQRGRMPSMAATSMTCVSAVAMPSTSAGVSPASFSARRAASACNWIIDISGTRSEEHTSELQSLVRISYAVFCLKKKKKNKVLNEYRLTHTTPLQQHLEE